MIRFQFVYDHRTEFSVKRMCHVLKLNRSSFYKWVQTREERRLKTCSDALIGARIKSIFDDEYGLYGAKRIAASLKADTSFGPINHKKVARIMKAMGLKGFTKRRRCITVRCEFLVPVFWGLGTVVFRVVGTGPRGASARTVSLSCLGWWVRWLCACRSLRYGFGGRC